MFRSPLRSPLSSPLSSPTGTVTNPNLLAALPWIQGTNTTMTIAGGRVRAASIGGSNPRVYKTVTGLTNGATYKFNGQTWLGTSVSTILRIGTVVDLQSADIFDSGFKATDFNYVDQTFVMVGTTAHMGLVVVVNVNGEYGEIAENLSLLPV